MPRADGIAEAREALRRLTDEGPCTLSLRVADRVARECGCIRREVEILALSMGIVPLRYERNLGTIGLEGQRRLLESTVAVVGCGGLGGWAAEGLARMGVGHLILVDADTFEEGNLNRQLGCLESTLGRPKAECLARRLAEVNAAVEVTAHVARLTDDGAVALLGGAQVVVDALDSLPDRFVLARAAEALGVPLVHGAIAGCTGQVMTILPGDAGLAALYGGREVPRHGVEVRLGNPAATPMMVAAWQVHETVKALVGGGSLIRGRLLLMDAEWGEVGEIHLDPGDGGAGDG